MPNPPSICRAGPYTTRSAGRTSGSGWPPIWHPRLRREARLFGSDPIRAARMHGSRGGALSGSSATNESRADRVGAHSRSPAGSTIGRGRRDPPERGSRDRRPIVGGAVLLTLGSAATSPRRTVWAFGRVPARVPRCGSGRDPTRDVGLDREGDRHSTEKETADQRMLPPPACPTVTALMHFPIQERSAFTELSAKLTALCAWCRHSEFIHCDNEAGPCLFSECECPRYFLMPEPTAAPA